MTTPPDSRPAQDGEVGVGEHHQGDVPVPAGIRSDLVSVEPDLALGPARSDSRWSSAGLRSARDRQRAGRRVGKIEGRLVRIGQRATNQKRALETGRGPAIGDTGLLIQTRPLGTLARAQALPDGRVARRLRIDRIGKPVGDRAHG